MSGTTRLKSSHPDPSRSSAPASAGAALRPPPYGVEFVDRQGELDDDAPIQAKLAPGHAPAALSAPAAGGGGLPAEVRGKMERSFGASFADVTIRPDSARAAGLGALALTQGKTIEFAPGRYRPFTREGQELLGHELTHVLQQRGGLVRGDSHGKSQDVRRSTALGLHHDVAAERQADECGKKAAEGEAIADPSLARAVPGGADDASAPIQPKMGFELEMLVLIDQNGRPVPEKTDVGHYGNHVSLDVDQGPAVSALTPALPETGNFDAQPGFTGHYMFNEATSYDTLQDAIDDDTFWSTVRGGSIVPAVGAYMVAVRDAQENGADFNAFKAQDNTPEIAQLVKDAVTNLQQAERVRLLPLHGNDPNSEGFKNAFAAERRRLNNRDIVNSKRLVSDEFMRLLALNVGVQRLIAQINLQTYHTKDLTGEAVHRNDGAGLGMGNTAYASILELVTKAYSPETDSGVLNILAAVRDAAEFAGKIDAVDPRANRVKLNTIGGTRDVDDKYYIGNPRQKAQTTDASIQCTFALDLAQVASFIKSTMAPGAQSFYHTKHDEDFYDNTPTYHYRAEEQIVLAVADATATLNEFVNPPDLPNLRGLLILMAQLMRLGKYSLTADGAHLDKNVSALLSRTNYAQIRLGMPQAERDWLAGKEATIKGKLLTKTGRTAVSYLLTNPAQTKLREGWDITTGTFIDNVLTTADDGITDRFGGFKQMGAEEVHPKSSKLAESRKLGPVFELRNMLPFLEGNERFTRDQWLPLARYLTTVIRTLHERTDAQAMRDVTVKTQAPGGQNPGAHTDTTLAATWKA